MKADGMDIGQSLVFLGNRQERANAGGERAPGLAWQLAMEKAQLEAWLSHGVVGFATMALAAETPVIEHAVVRAGTACPALMRFEAVPVTHDTSTSDQSSERKTCSSPVAALEVEKRQKEPLEELHAPDLRLAPAAFLVGEAGGGRQATSPTGLAQSLDPSARPVALQSAASPQVLPPPATVRPQQPDPAHAQVILGAEETAQLATMLRSLGAVDASMSVQRAPFPGLPADVEEGDAVPTALAGLRHHAIEVPTQELVHQLPPASGDYTMAAAAGLVSRSKVVFDGERHRDAVFAQSRGLEASSSAVPHQPLRLHADWSEEGVRLWLGVDTGMTAGLQAITVQLQRWLASQGVKLLSLSCNGRTVNAESMLVADTFEADSGTDEAIGVNPLLQTLRNSHGNQCD